MKSRNTIRIESIKSKNAFSIESMKFDYAVRSAEIV